MIWESIYWKRELIKDATILEKWCKRKPTNRQYVLFEKKLFISAYSIRKLIEAEKIGPDFPMWNYQIEIFQKIINSKKIDFMNKHELNEFYDFDKPVGGNISIDRICNALIHSYIFCLGENEKSEIDSFLFSSDKDIEKFIYKMSIEKFINMLKWIGHSDVCDIDMKRDKDDKSVFKIKRNYSFDALIPRKGLPKILLTYTNDLIENGSCIPAIVDQSC